MLFRSGPYDTNSYDKAISTFEAFLKGWPAKPQTPEAIYQIARNHVSANRPEPAIKAYQELVNRFPDHDLSPYAALEIGTTYAGLNKKNNMIEAFRAFINKYPNHAKVGDVRYAVATELEATNRLDEAVLAYRDIINNALAAPQLTDDSRNAAISAVLRITGITEKRNDPKTVVADLEQFVDKFANDDIAARTLVGQIAGVYAKNRQSDDGLVKLEELAQKYAANNAIRQAAVISMTEIAVADKKIDRANALVARLLADPAKDKLPPSALLTIGKVSMRTDKFTQAKENYERALEVAALPRDKTLAQAGLGQALLGLKQYDAAQSAFLTALQDERNVASVVNETQLGLAKTYEAKGQTEDAMKLYRPIALGKGELSFEAAGRMGNIFAKSESPDPAKMKEYKISALQFYGRLLFAPASPLSDEAAYRSGECHEYLKNPAQACSAFQSYLKRFPNGRFVDEAKAKIRVVCAPPKAE